jgi:hypothetical protein
MILVPCVVSGADVEDVTEINLGAPPKKGPSSGASPAGGNVADFVRHCLAIVDACLEQIGPIFAPVFRDKPSELISGWVSKCAFCHWSLGPAPVFPCMLVSFFPAWAPFSFHLPSPAPAFHPWSPALPAHPH